MTPRTMQEAYEAGGIWGIEIPGWDSPYMAPAADSPEELFASALKAGFVQRGREYSVIRETRWGVGHHTGTIGADDAGIVYIEEDPPCLVCGAPESDHDPHCCCHPSPPDSD